MRAVLVGLFGSLLFCMLCPFAQYLMLGADHAGYYPAPSLSLRYLRWLLDVLLPALVAAVPTAFLMWRLWRLVAR